MIFGDIVALAKQGYTPQDIKELIELSKADESKEPEQKDPEKTDDHVNGEDEPKKPEKENGSENSRDDSVDYKALYEAEKDKTSKLQSAMSKIDISGSSDKKSDIDVLSEAMKSFM